jgi:hypothetical protein
VSLTPSILRVVKEFNILESLWYPTNPAFGLLIRESTEPKT